MYKYHYGEPEGFEEYYSQKKIAAFEKARIAGVLLTHSVVVDEEEFVNSICTAAAHLDKGEPLQYGDIISQHNEFYRVVGKNSLRPVWIAEEH